jgi:hypothetical protein
LKKLPDCLKPVLNDNIWVAYCDKGNWTKWHRLKDWKRYFPDKPYAHRQILPNEIVIESDFPTVQDNFEFAENICSVLKDKLISHSVWFSGNKSYHIHILFVQNSNTEQKLAWVESIIGKENCSVIDKSNLNKKHLILAENAVNYKSGNRKTLLSHFGYWLNLFPEMESKVKQDKPIEWVLREPFIPEFGCPIIEFALNHKLPEGDRNQIIAPNLMALNPNIDTIKKFCEVQGMNWSQVGDWIKSDKYCHTFNCKQLRNYAKKYNLEQLCIYCYSRINYNNTWS